VSIAEISQDVHVAHQQALLSILKEFDRVCEILNIPYVLFAGTMLGAVRHKGFIPWDDDIDVLMLRKDYMRFLREAEKILNVEKFFLQKEFSEHWPMFFSKLRLNNTTCLETYHPKDINTHLGIYIDIFPADSAANSDLMRKLQFFASKVVIAKSLDSLGYETNSIKKRAFMKICRLLPVKPFLTFVKREDDNSEYLHSFLGAASAFSKNVYPRELFARSISAVFEDEEYPIPEKYDEILRIMYGDYMALPPEEKRICKQHAVLVDLDKSYENYYEYHKSMVFENTTRSIR